MIIGEEKITETVDAMRENIARDDDLDGELAEVDEVFLIVALHYGPADGRDGEVGNVFYRCTSARPHVQFGLLTQAHRAIEKALEGGEE